MSTIDASVVIINEATPHESVMAVLTTFVGSIIPLCIKSQYSPIFASKPCVILFPSKSLSTTIDPSYPEFEQIVLQGILHASFTIFIPISWSKFAPLRVFKAYEAYNRATPPPGTMPSSEAARVAHRASSILSLSSETSTSDDPPTFIIATPPVSLPNLSDNFSLS